MARQSFKFFTPRDKPKKRGPRQHKKNKNNNINYQCIKSMAELEKNIDGSLSIKKLILE